MRTKKRGPPNFSYCCVVAQDVADVLAQEALDALPELLHAVGLGLRDTSSRCRFRGLNAGIFLLTSKFHLTSVTRSLMSGNDLIGRTVIVCVVRDSRREPRLAHEPRLPVDLGAARAALGRLAVPAAREVGRAVALDPVDGVEDDHADLDGDLVLLELALAGLAAEDVEGGVGRSLASPRTASRAPRGISGQRRPVRRPCCPSTLRIRMLTLGERAPSCGKSIRL